MKTRGIHGLVLMPALLVASAGCDSLLSINATFVDGSVGDGQTHPSSSSNATGGSTGSNSRKGPPKHDAGMGDAGHDATMGTMKKDGGSGKDATTHDTGHPVTKDGATEDAP